MRIRQMSDLHLEFSGDFEPANNTNCDVLMLNGDICVAEYFGKSEASPYYVKAQQARRFFEYVSNEYQHVVYIPGNHENYGGHLDTTDDILREVIAPYPNIKYLSNEFLDYEGTRFIGTTLWTDVNKGDPLSAMHLKNSMNDFRCIQKSKAVYSGKFTPQDSVAVHRQSLAFINHASKDHDNVIVMSHHAPSHKSVHSKYHNDTQTNYGYYSDLDEFILDRPQIKLWTHGHMHDCFDYMIGTTRVVCNPRGYRDENKFFKYDQVL